MLGADRVIATRMEIEDGKYTGDIELLRLRRGEGARDPRPRPRPRLRPRRPATPTATRSPTCTCSRWSATRTPSTPTRSCAGSRRAAAGRSWCSPSRSRCAAGCRCPPAKPTLAALAVGGVVGDRRRALGQRQAAPPRRLTHPSAPKSQALKSSGPGRRNGEQQLQEPAREPGTHAAIYPSYRALGHPGYCPGQQLDNARLVASDSRVSGGTRIRDESGAARIVGRLCSVRAGLSRRSGLASAPLRCSASAAYSSQRVHARPARRRGRRAGSTRTPRRRARCPASGTTSDFASTPRATSTSRSAARATIPLCEANGAAVARSACTTAATSSAGDRRLGQQQLRDSRCSRVGGLGVPRTAELRSGTEPAAASACSRAKACSGERP